MIPAHSTVESDTTQSAAVSRGVEHAHVIDIVAHDANRDEAVLIMLESRPWDESEPRLFQLQEKINAYLAFALDGEMAEFHPDLMTKRLRLQIDCVDMPGPAVVEFLSVVREQIAFQNVDLEVRVMGTPGCGADCACGDPNT